MSLASQRGYDPLPDPQGNGDGKSWTRIMTLQPGDSSAALIANLSPENIQECEPYEALSYVWGQETAAERLIRNGVPTRITKNLDIALRNFRLSNEPRRLWVDAVCIDQQNLDERASQVKIMRRIYEHAAHVQVWLGPSLPGVEEGFSLASQLAELRRAIPQNKQDVSFNAGVKALSRALVDDYIDPDLPAWEHLAELFKLEWWRRTWCVQEVVSSSNCSARCGDLEIRMADLLAASTFVRQRRTNLFSGSTLEFWDSVFHTKFQSTTTSTAPRSLGDFLALLARTRDFKASDPRDKIFAFYGITDEGLAADLARIRNAAKKDAKSSKTLGGMISGWIGNVGSLLGVGTHKGIEPDYHKSVAQVYRDATRLVLVRNGRAMLDALSHVHHMKDVDDPFHGQCPTWVPHWFEPQASTPLGCHSWFTSGLVNPARIEFEKSRHAHEHRTSQRPRFEIPPMSTSFEHRIFQPPHLEVPSMPAASNRLNTTSIGQRRRYEFDQRRHLVNTTRNTNQSIPTGPSNRDILSLKGFRIGHVVKVSTVITADIEEKLPVGQLWHELFDTQLDSADARSARYFDGGPLLSAFGITLSACGYNRQKVGRDREQMLIPPLTDFEAYMEVHDDAKVTVPVSQNGAASTFGNASQFEELAKAVCYNRRLFITESGHLGLGPKFLQPQDLICVLVGGKMPFALRPRVQSWALVGEVYLHDLNVVTGATADEAVRGEGELRMEDFRIV